MLGTTHTYHDGAIIVNLFDAEGRFSPVIHAVRVWLPLVDRSRVNLVIAGRGTRHVTAYDVSELTLADVFVNSEQRGEALLMHQGQVDQNIDDDRIVGRILESCRTVMSEENVKPYHYGSAPLSASVQHDLVCKLRCQPFEAGSHADYFQRCYFEAHLQLHERHPIGVIIPGYEGRDELVVPGTDAYAEVTAFVEYNAFRSLDKYETHLASVSIGECKQSEVYFMIEFGNVYIGGFGLRYDLASRIVFLANVFLRPALIHDGFLFRLVSKHLRMPPCNLFFEKFVFHAATRESVVQIDDWRLQRLGASGDSRD
ncbi:hypothetical protein AAVH_22274, partial [Aphelenchoides avenae]